MNCGKFLEQLEEFGLKGPDFTLSPDLHEHQRGCASCRKRLFELRETWLLMAAALEKQPISLELEAKVMQRVEKAAQNSLKDDPRSSSIWKYVLAASVLLALTGATILSPNWLNDRVADQNLRHVEELARQMGKLEELQTSFANPELKYVSLTAGGNENRVQGYFVYDFVAKEAHFFGYDLIKSEHQSFVLWLLDTNQNVIGSAPIDVNSAELGATIVKLPPDISLLDEVIVSLETDRSPVRPSDDVRMRSKIGL